MVVGFCTGAHGVLSAIEAHVCSANLKDITAADIRSAAKPNPCSNIEPSEDCEKLFATPNVCVKNLLYRFEYFRLHRILAYKYLLVPLCVVISVRFAAELFGIRGLPCHQLSLFGVGRIARFN